MVHDNSKCNNKLMSKPIINSDINLLKDTFWDEKGYALTSLFTKLDYFKEFKLLIHKLIAHNIYKLGYDISNFKLENYHQLIKSDKEHLNFIKNNNHVFLASYLGRFKDTIEAKVSEICEKKVSAKHPDYEDEIFSIRIVRPNKKDNNPLHRDVWLERLRNAINIYIPIAGSNYLSSLPLIPGSHYWSDKEIDRSENGALINGVQYTVPVVKTIYKSNYEIIRPNPNDNEILIFSPYLLHGGATNLNNDVTRVSLEMRFWLKK